LKYQGVRFDTHVYQVVNEDVSPPSIPIRFFLRKGGEVKDDSLGLGLRAATPPLESRTCQRTIAMTSTLSSYPNWVLIEERMSAMTDRAKYSNGRRYDGSKGGSDRVSGLLSNSSSRSFCRSILPHSFKPSSSLSLR
jgi:hypothetical protein